MKILSLFLEGFRSFVEPVTFSFEDRLPGLYFMTGNNREEKTLGANAAGKSTLWDGLCWVLYGKTSRGLKGPEVRSWKKTGRTCGSIYFSFEGTHYELRRTVQPNSLSWINEDGDVLETATQDEVESLIKLSYSAFLNTVLIGQFNTSFFDLLPSQKERVFSQALDLDYWLDKSKQASTSVSSIAKEVDGVASERDTLLGSFEQSKSITFIDEAEEWKDSLVTRKKEIQVKLNKKQNAIDKLSTSRIDLENQLEDIILEKEELQEELYEVIQKCSEYKEVISYLEKQTVAAGTTRTILEEQLDSLEGISGTCTLCKQPVSKRHLKKEQEKLVAKVDLVDAGREECFKKLEISKIREQEYSSQERKITKQLKAAADETLYLKNSLRTLNSDCKRMEKECSELEGDILHLVGSANPFEEKEKEQRIKEGMLRRELSIAQVHLHQLSEQELAYKFWVQGFREVRLFLMENALLQFEVAVTDALYQLGLFDWGVSLTTDKQSKKGAYLGKGFQVLINSPTVNKKVPWEVWSGGETQRLSLSGTVGFSALILDRLGIQTNIEIWDEPSNWLSEEGIRDLLDFLEYRARTENKQIWLVDHRALEFGGFSGKAIVIRDERGSYIEEEVC